MRSRQSESWPSRPRRSGGRRIPRRRNHDGALVEAARSRLLRHPSPRFILPAAPSACRYPGECPAPGGRRPAPGVRRQDAGSCTARTRSRGRPPSPSRGGSTHDPARDSDAGQACASSCGAAPREEMSDLAPRRLGGSGLVGLAARASVTPPLPPRRVPCVGKRYGLHSGQYGPEYDQAFARRGIHVRACACPFVRVSMRVRLRTSARACAHACTRVRARACACALVRGSKIQANLKKSTTLAQSTRQARTCIAPPQNKMIRCHTVQNEHRPNLALL